MGTFSVSLSVANPTNGKAVEVKAEVDTGSIFSVMPQSLLNSLGISPTEHRQFTVATGEIVTYPVGEARFGVDGRARTSPVVFGKEGVHLLGAVSLEAFGLIADTTNQQLIPPPTLYLL